MRNKSTTRLLALTAALLLGGTLGASAQEPNLAGKTVQMIIGFGPGGGYDLWARTVARHIGKHMPGKPNVVAQNMPGAGSFTAAAHIYAAAPKDGTAMGIIARDAALGPLTGQEGARFDATKITWLGTPTTETSVCFAHKNAKVKTANDMLTTEIIMGDTGPGTGAHAYPKALNALLGMKMKLVGGYPSSSDVFLAIERGEVEGMCESLDSVHGKRPDWVEKKTVTLLFQGAAEPNPEIKEVPFVVNFAKDDDTKKAIEFLYAGQGIGRPFVAPPDLPPAVRKMMRDAFNATMKDPEFIAEVKARKLDLAPVTGEQLEALIKRMYATPKAIVDKVGSLIR